MFLSFYTWGVARAARHQDETGVRRTPCSAHFLLLTIGAGKTRTKACQSSWTSRAHPVKPLPVPSLLRGQSQRQHSSPEGYYSPSTETVLHNLSHLRPLRIGNANSTCRPTRERSSPAALSASACRAAAAGRAAGHGGTKVQTLSCKRPYRGTVHTLCHRISAHPRCSCALPNVVVLFSGVCSEAQRRPNPASGPKCVELSCGCQVVRASPSQAMPARVHSPPLYPVSCVPASLADSVDQEHCQPLLSCSLIFAAGR